MILVTFRPDVVWNGYTPEEIFFQAA